MPRSPRVTGTSRARHSLARRIDPNSQRAVDGARRARLLTGGCRSSATRRRRRRRATTPRPEKDFSHAPALDPENDGERRVWHAPTPRSATTATRARSGLGFAALGRRTADGIAGRLPTGARPPGRRARRPPRGCNVSAWRWRRAGRGAAPTRREPRGAGALAAGHGGYDSALAGSRARLRQARQVPG